MLSEKEVLALKKEGSITGPISPLEKKPKPVDKKLDVLSGIKKSIDEIDLKTEVTDARPLYEDVKRLYGYVADNIKELKAIKTKEVKVEIPDRPRRWVFTITRDHQGELVSVEALAK